MTDIVERLRGWATDWDGSQMVDDEPPRDGLHCGLLREAADEIERLHAINEDMLALLKELVDIEGPQPGTSTWGDKVLGVIAKSRPAIPTPGE